MAAVARVERMQVSGERVGQGNIVMGSARNANRGNSILKLKHWCGSPGGKCLNAAPVLGFGLVMGA